MLLQPPQLRGSLLVSTHDERVTPLIVTVQRFIEPVPHDVVAATHAPALHSSPVAHCLPQAPQAKGLLEVSTHAVVVPPPAVMVHCVKPGRHAQVPEPLQYCELPHCVKQLPQRLGLSSVSVQTPGVNPPQTGIAVVVPGRLGQVHALDAHDARSGQRL